ncbi:hypothetical protein EUU23_13945 [Sphingorhabdus sp. IMCC26285]|jgi:hypothetical protein|uniref:Uncharacterized protein n=1 Tax=Sphingorhabdus profundilacus TaxID=2509718 RepID=A0A6I4M4K5_9SPHN|nr:hypothetical protein [Sphingorhabdus profundilacus]MVZ98790.1 hypothetical protein [Sphingorhabdus profundilacus]
MPTNGSIDLSSMALFAGAALSLASATVASQVALGLGAMFALAAAIVSMRRFILTVDNGAIPISNRADEAASSC